MNCKQFNSILLDEVLLILGHHPTKQNEKEAWFLNPFGTETQASFKLDKRLNLWFLHSEGIGGNNINFMTKYLNVSISEILEWAEQQHFSSFQYQDKIQSFDIKPNYEITTIKELQNFNLKKYLQERGLSPIVFPFVKEIHFKMNEKQLYAIGFENLSGGWELRNSFYKGSILKKDISIIPLNLEENKNQNPQKSVSVFEGFMDALSFIEMQKNFSGDLLVMNSISLLNKTKEYLKKYAEVHLFLDNDNAGENCKNAILKDFPHAKNNAEIYSGFKDLNAFISDTKKSENMMQNLKTDQQEEQETTNTTQLYRRKR